jgi:hypothetical protein
MPDFIYKISTVELAIYSSLLFVGLTWFGISSSSRSCA